MSDPKPANSLGVKCPLCGRPADGDVMKSAPDTGGEPPKTEDITLIGVCASCQGPGPSREAGSDSTDNAPSLNPATRG
jgi:hypothetical protein